MVMLLLLRAPKVGESDELGGPPPGLLLLLLCDGPGLVLPYGLPTLLFTKYAARSEGKGGRLEALP